MLIAGKMNCQLHTLNWWREKGWGCKMEKFLFSRKYFFIQINTFKSSLWVGGKQKLGGKMEKSKLSCQILEKKGEKTKWNGEIQIKESRRSVICKVSFTIPKVETLKLIETSEHLTQKQEKKVVFLSSTDFKRWFLTDIDHLQMSHDYDRSMLKITHRENVFFLLSTEIKL